MTGADAVPHGSHWGAFEAVVRDGRLVATRPRADDPDPTPIVGGIAEAVNSAARIRTPVVRRGWLEHGPGATSARRGADEFVPVSWDRALDLVAGELDRVRREHGNPAIFGGSYGWSSAGRFHHAKTQLARLLNLLGGCTAQISNYSFAAADAVLPHVLGTARPGGGHVTSWDVLAGHTRLWVALGGLPAKNTQVEGGGTLRHGYAANLRAVRRAGCRFVCVSPIRDDAPAHLDAEWIPIRPGTDTALLLGIAFTLLERRWHDEEFLRRYCTGWPRVRAYLTGDADGVPKTPGWAGRVTGVPEAVVRRLAAAMARHRTMLSATWSLQRADNGEQPYWMLITLAAMLGQIGLPGGGFGFAYGCEDGIGSTRYPFPAPELPRGVNPAGSAIPVARIADMLLHPGQSYEFAGQTRTYPDTRLVYWAGGNPFHHHQDLNRLAAAWRRPETVVVNEIWWTATARRADIVLPATSTLERNDIAASSRDAHLVAMRRAIGPLHDARHDHDIFAGVAARLGVGAAFTEGLDEMGWLRRIYDDFRAGAARHGATLPEFDEFWAAGRIRVWPGARTVLLGDFRADPRRHPLHTPSGRIELYSEVVAGYGYAETPGHAAWIPPREWLGAPLAARYPLHLLSNQPATRLHSQLDMAGVSAASKIDGREPCRMHPRDARARGIAPGDTVRIFNDRGACLAGAVLDDAVMEGVVQLSTGAWFTPADPAADSLELHGNPNVLTPDRGTSRLGQGPSAHSTLVEVEPVRGPAPAPDAFAPPAGL
ncbi:molybdopterin guanine dinucleotide-containing S/N-oxide reductase [Dactylosporangium sp. CA-092794]|uniref:molybdopterin guanine dinucleotide-containing S/N-oxide reductase n=1 Tax=Dactylosporangium sp. CA-092794 TaxID=3239929 RepID=UPI003D92813B